MYRRGIIFIFMLFLILGCAKIEKGELVSVKITKNLDKIYFENILILKLENGNNVEAVCRKEILPKMDGRYVITGGQKFEIEYKDSLKMWEVIRIIE
jgi:hypothetical protein